MKIIVALFLLVSTLAWGQGTITADKIIIQGSGAMGSMPDKSSNLQSIHVLTPTSIRPSATFGVTSSQDMPNSGPQGIEGYTYTNQTGTTTLSLGIIGNVEHGGSGITTSMRAVQGGFYISGSGGGDHAAAFAANGGRIRNGTGTYTNGYGLYVDVFRPGFTNKYGVYVADPTADNYFAGTVTVGSGRVVMKNGSCPQWSAPGTGTLCVDAGGSLTFVGMNGLTTILAKP